MTWNYRVIKSIDSNGEVSFAIHEVHYDENHKPCSCTVQPISLYAESLEELKADIDLIQKALSNSVLEMLYFDNLAEESNN